MSFLEPLRLWFLLIIPVLVALYIALQHRKANYTVRFTNMALLDAVVPRRVNWRQHAAVGLALLTLASGIVLFAKPSKDVEVPVAIDARVTVMLAIDVSLSMQATDVAPDRLSAAMAAADTFLERLPENFKAGLVSFAGSAEVVVPPTLDHLSVRTAVEGLKLAERTATGEGIYTALQSIEQDLGDLMVPGGTSPGLIVLLSDGSRTVGRSQVDAAREAKAQGVPVFTVALGTEEGSIVNHDTLVPVPVDREQMQEVADLSGGEAYVASTPDDLLDAYDAVNGQLQVTTEQADATSDYLPYLLVLLLLSTGAGLFVASRWP